MKKLLLLVLAVLLCAPAMAEESVLAVELLPQESAVLPLESALTAAQSAVGKVPEQAMIRARLAELSDGTEAWVVTIFDTGSLADAWCVTVDASTGTALSVEAAQEGFFVQIFAAWTAQKGPHALWSMEDKQLYDALYVMAPAYGLPTEGDLSAEAALDKALSALGLTGTDGYSVGYGYLMGGEDVSGVWEISLVIDGQVDCQVNLDAVTGEVYYLVRNQLEPDDANG